MTTNEYYAHLGIYEIYYTYQVFPDGHERFIGISYRVNGKWVLDKDR